QYIDRLIDLSLPGAGSGSAFNAVSNLAMLKLREIDSTIGKFVDKENKPSPELDAYTAAHLVEAKNRIEKALDAQFIYNGGGSMSGFNALMFGKTTEQSNGVQQQQEPVR